MKKSFVLRENQRPKGRPITKPAQLAVAGLVAWALAIILANSGSVADRSVWLSGVIIALNLAGPLLLLISGIWAVVRRFRR